MNPIYGQSFDDRHRSRWASKYPDPNIPTSSLRVANSSAECQAGRKLVVICKEQDSHGQMIYSVLWVGDEDVAKVSEKFLETSTHPL